PPSRPLSVARNIALPPSARDKSRPSQPRSESKHSHPAPWHPEAEKTPPATRARRALPLWSSVPPVVKIFLPRNELLNPSPPPEHSSPKSPAPTLPEPCKTNPAPD